MALQARTEFASALNQVCSERGVEPEVVIDSIKQAILAAYRKDYGEPEGIEVDLDANTGEVKLNKGKKDVTPAGFGRIAAQTAKQVILQRIREAEKDAIMTEYSSKVGTLVTGIIQRISGPVATVNLGKAEGIMPPQEQASNENYSVNQRLKFYVVGIKEGPRGEEIIVSRSAPGLLEALFKQEVPEIASGAVEVRAIAREGGSRSKIAVSSGQLGVDPVGSCVGQKGVRVQAVMNELGDEKIDIIAYQENPEEFIKSALSPAKEISVKIDEETKTAEVTVPDDQLSLAIGKEGQNVRLAAKLTGYKIDIRGKSGTPKEVEEKERKAQEEAKKALGITDSQKTQEDTENAQTPKEKGTAEAKTVRPVQGNDDQPPAPITDDKTVPQTDEQPTGQEKEKEQTVPEPESGSHETDQTEKQPAQTETEPQEPKGESKDEQPAGDTGGESADGKQGKSE
jgi:N utilization substance protein A